MNVIFVEPAFPHNQREFVRALAGIGASLTGVGERPGHSLDDALRGMLDDIGRTLKVHAQRQVSGAASSRHSTS